MPGNRLVDIAGQRFGRLVALNPTRSDVRKEKFWLCQCDCGKTTEVLGSSLRLGHTRSCGCLGAEVSEKRMTTHAMYGTPEHTAWSSMLTRVRNPNCKGWPTCGGKGIGVVDEWLSFEGFYADLGPRPAKGFQLCRLDPDDHFRPGNVEWMTRKEWGLLQRRHKKPASR
jgi:hypothetical protein